jgi:hypothetical protein
MGQMNNGELLTANPAGHSLVDKLEEVLKDNKCMKEQLVIMNNKMSSLTGHTAETEGLTI